MRTRTELDIFLPVLRPVSYCHKGWNLKIAGDIKHPKPASGLGKLGLQITDIRIANLAEVDFRPLQAIVPPDCVGVPFHQLEETLDNCFRQRVAGRAAVGIRVVGAGTSMEKIQEAGRKISEAFVA